MYVSKTVDFDVDLEDFDTFELISELEHRAKKGDREAGEALKGVMVEEIKDIWLDVESALERRDFEWLARWLWPQVKAQAPKPLFVAMS